MTEAEILDSLREYLEGGDQSGFGAKEPWAGLSSDGGLEAMLEKIAVNVASIEECPDEDCALSAMQLGQAVANSGLTAKEEVILRSYMMIAYGSQIAFYREGLNAGKLSAEETKSKVGTHGGSIPSKTLAQEIEELKGMPWQAVVVVTSVLYRGIVPTGTEIDKYGYGSDPAAWASTILDRKTKKRNFNDFHMARDAVGYRAMVLKGATRMSQNRQWAAYAAVLILCVNKLSSMTFDQGRSDLFLNYFEEHMEAHKGEGLYKSTRPLDPQILEETVLSQKGMPEGKPGAEHAFESKWEKKFEETAAAERSLRDMLKTEQSKNASIMRKMEALELKMGAAPPKVPGGFGGGPPSAENPCHICGAADHFGRDCPQHPRKLAEQRRIEKEVANKEE